MSAVSSSVSFVCVGHTSCIHTCTFAGHGAKLSFLIHECDDEDEDDDDG